MTQGNTTITQSTKSAEIGARVVLAREQFDALLQALRNEGYDLHGPTPRDGAIVYDRIEGAADLPAGFTDEQGPGVYRLKPREDQALFGYAVGPHSYQREFLVPKVSLFHIRRSASGPAIEPEPLPDRKLALIGARSCELAAVAVQDRVLTEGPHADADYAARRRGIFVLAVNCTEPSGTCFCASMNTGPRATRGFDLALTELLEPSHRFVIEVGSPAGAALLERVVFDAAPAEDVSAAEAAVARAADRMGRKLDTEGIKELFYRNLEHPRWDDVASRCIACANCTMVCPTCFCTTVEDTTSLDGEEATRTRRWDSCFTVPFSYIHGGSIRTSVRGRYRQWITHKLATWLDQFGESGCVGCGRCITWCPVGIDITEEAAAIRATDGQKTSAAPSEPERH
ncbi:MAG: 4Fe-4S dicluster domain-containing protein [Polyangiaceae bacterium]|nr:4Fe-4S dicluster domain-containing protein [Polyangiaceae bacterium]